MKDKISVIIPTLNAEKYIDKLIKVLQSQTIVPDEIIVIDSQSDDATISICKKFNGVKTISILRKDFDHGGTRNIAFKSSIGDYVLYITQDAVPIDNNYIESLIEPFKDKDVAMVSGRQVAREDATLSEKLTRNFNYSDKSFVRDKSDIPTLGIKTFFASDVCSAYRRTTFEKLGYFKEPILINEDMDMATKCIFAGYKIAYCAEAKVYHSHTYTFKQQYVRNFDVGAFMAMNSETFKGVSATSEGIKMVKIVLSQMIKGGHIASAIKYIFESGVKYIGHRRGINFKKLSKEQILKSTMNKSYWINYYF